MEYFDVMLAKALSGSGGGSGDSGLTLLGTQSLGHIEQSSTSATDTGLTISVNDAGQYDGMFIFIKADNDTSGYMGSMFYMMFAYDTVSDDYEHSTRNKVSTKGSLNVVKESNGKIKANTNSTTGIYPGNETLTSGDFSAKVFAKYNSNNTGRINNDFTATYYGVSLFGKFVE